MQLRQAATASLRQLAQRQPALVVQHGPKLIESLFTLLDSESEQSIISDLRDTIRTLLAGDSTQEPSRWLRICNSVLSGTGEKQEAQQQQQLVQETKDDKDGDDDEEEGGASRAMAVPTVARTIVPTRWQTKVFAIECVREIVSACQSKGAKANPHFDLGLAREAPSRDYLVNKLGELVSIVFMAATSTVNQLREAGLETLQDIMRAFKGTVKQKKE